MLQGIHIVETPVSLKEQNVKSHNNINHWPKVGVMIKVRQAVIKSLANVRKLSAAVIGS